MSLKIKSLTAFLVTIAALTEAPQLVQGQTNLYSGYTKKKEGLIDDILVTKLSNDVKFPLVGLGVGNLPHNRIENMIYEGLKSEHRIRMIDTAHASLNEKHVAQGIVSGVKRFKQTEELEIPVQVHVVTKIWYTYLGYDRTKISIRESLEDLNDAIKDPNVDLKVHFLLHWPRCYDHIEWMNCEQEEQNLPVEVQKAGPPPHLDKANAWKGSWKALEDMYTSGDYPMIASIGVSNFGDQDLTALLDVARITPHMTQINIWALAFDMPLVEICNRHNIHIQLYNIMNGVISSIFSNPNAHHQLLKIANSVHQKDPTNVPTVTASQALLKWLVQFGMSVIPRTSNLDRLSENSAVALKAIPDLEEHDLERLAEVTAALLSGNDMAEDAFVDVTFYAQNEDMFLYLIAGENDQQHVAFIAKGDSYEERTHPHQKFRLYDAVNPDNYHDYVVDGKYGDQKEVRVALL